MSAPATPALDLPLGTYPDGATASLSLVTNNGAVRNTLIVGETAVGKTTLLQQLGRTANEQGIATLHIDRGALAEDPDPWTDLAALHEQRWHAATGPRHDDMPAGLLLIDATPALMEAYAWQLFTMLATLRHERIGLAMAVHSVAASAFAGVVELRDALLHHGNVAVLRSRDRTLPAWFPNWTGPNLANLATGQGFVVTGDRPTDVVTVRQ